MRSQHLSAAEAAARLGVSRSSLYAYVSRGRIHAEPDPRNPRESRVPRRRTSSASAIEKEAAGTRTWPRGRLLPGASRSWGRASR